MAKRYVVHLSAADRTLLTDLIMAGEAATRAQTHARILRKADQGPDGPVWIDAEIVAALVALERTVERVREAWVTRGVEAASYPRPARAPRHRRFEWARKRTWSPWPAPRRLSAKRAGRCGCSPNGWWN